MLSSEQMQIHKRAVEIALSYRRIEGQLLLVLQEVQRTKLYKKLNRSSLFMYAVHELGLSEATAYAFISVAGKAIEVPQLMNAVQTQELTVSKASRLCSAINADNAKALIQFAKGNSSQKIDREIARLNPKAAKPDKIKPISEEYTHVEMTVSRKVLAKLKRAQELESSRGVNGLSDVLEAVLDEYLKHKDPVKKADRAQQRKKQFSEIQELAGASGEGCAVAKQYSDDRVTKLCLSRVNRSARVSLTADQKHAVFARDRGRCTHLDDRGNRCESERWLHVHHIKPVSHGGGNEPENLTTLCSFHHDLAHQLSLPIEGQVTWLRSPRVRYG